MLRPLVHFFLIGGLLFSAKAVYERNAVQGPAITVRVPVGASTAEVENKVREAILLNEARRYGWDRTDPIVYTHLIRNMRFIEPDSEDDDLTLFQRAIEMNMHAHDPVVRARLLYRAREALAFVPEERMPTRTELEEHLRTHSDRFEREQRVRFRHVFLSRSKRSETLAADAREMRDRLAELDDSAPSGLGDPLPNLRPEQSATPSELEDDYGAELAGLVQEGLIGAWRGPVSSVYGLHFIQVIDQEPAYVPPLDVIGAEVRADRLRELRKALAQERMAALRDAYRVTIERAP
ncbi:MAG: peptidyl-prolyl cis-trans isomerase [Deltaproteobacteria bacterium]|nr:peptidyl-prolyl cis-trans isomerase [Deltaproteobacteria bacterium]NND28784.1 peptidyl-prolyl cis-trans isomerase [Myxococcales bacterium]MBT8466765.1 peptidyl-prolyl cis-trans isomerase [Deltaproteobacteria bacterium]MBT8481202.1 peptidyl-prolyl cis-trans isomerase [Deltaproteobacteria bacterium]NNK07340.1 peptidyl-prolyl cis-trans isomerase [Myxococcales bacterium]